MLRHSGSTFCAGRSRRRPAGGAQEPGEQVGALATQPARGRNLLGRARDYTRLAPLSRCRTAAKPKQRPVHALNAANDPPYGAGDRRRSIHCQSSGTAGERGLVALRSTRHCNLLLAGDIAAAIWRHRPA